MNVAEYVVMNEVQLNGFLANLEDLIFDNRIHINDAINLVSNFFDESNSDYNDMEITIQKWIDKIKGDDGCI